MLGLDVVTSILMLFSRVGIHTFDKVFDEVFKKLHVYNKNLRQEKYLCGSSAVGCRTT